MLSSSLRSQLRQLTKLVKPLIRSVSLRPGIFKLEIDPKDLANPSEKNATDDPALKSIKGKPSPPNSKADDIPEHEAENLFDVFDDLFPSKKQASEEVSSLFDRMLEERSVMKEAPSQPPQNSDVIREERSLFEKIFENYSQSDNADRSAERVHESVLTSLQDSFPENHAKSSQGRVSQDEKSEANDIYTTALEPTVSHITNLATREQLAGFALNFFKLASSQNREAPEFYLRKRKGETFKEYDARKQKALGEIEARCKEDPSRPMLNAFTMPIIFNLLIKAASEIHHDGALALTLFNASKEDLGLYTVLCNQKTYNEMIKVHWIHFGKASLCEVELLVVEMMNSGFMGDRFTFAILKEVLATYHLMRMGKTKYNPGGIPIWLKEDEQRARNLNGKLKIMSQNLSGFKPRAYKPF